MSKKNFKKDNPALAFMSIQKEETKTTEPKEPIAHKTQEGQEVQMKQTAPPTQQHQEELTTRKAVHATTQGRKGKKLPRINMAFTKENHEYLTLMSSLNGISMTEYVNILLEADRENNQEIIEQAKILRKKVRGK